jgi:prepilin-type N-terminal cleavage/methylation domain-containing protein
MTKKLLNTTPGFTLVEIMVAISIIGILSSIVYANFGEARKAARDDVRKTSLKEMQLAIEFYKAQNDVYPSAGCGVATTAFAEANATCVNYVDGLIPDFMPALPRDPMSENVAGSGFMYRSDGANYKLMIRDAVEVKMVVAGDEYSNNDNDPDTYAVYSAGGINW